MALAELLATGATAGTNSDPFTLAEGESATLYLKDAAGPSLPNEARVDIQYADAAGQYYPIGGNLGSLTPNSPPITISGAGTFRVTRVSGACGVDKA
jgi:hypothetical protein